MLTLGRLIFLSLALLFMTATADVDTSLPTSPGISLVQTNLPLAGLEDGPEGDVVPVFAVLGSSGGNDDLRDAVDRPAFPTIDAIRVSAPSPASSPPPSRSPLAAFPTGPPTV
ncbi:MAG: hypothetical protein HY056_14710 [Proteobacteria bacterium]|nr:hypothetical protein [Pseudomonadota bacterium]